MSLGVIGCERSGFPAFCVLGKAVPEIWERVVEVRAVPCLGGVDELTILEALSWCDTLLLVGCPPLSCQNAWGSRLAEQRVARVSRLLEEAEIPKKVFCVFANLSRLGELKARVMA